MAASDDHTSVQAASGMTAWTRRAGRFALVSLGLGLLKSVTQGFCNARWRHFERRRKGIRRPSRQSNAYCAAACRRDTVRAVERNRCRVQPRTQLMCLEARCPERPRTAVI